jgi:hypothetical protein
MTSARAHAFDGYPPRERPHVLICGRGREIVSGEDAYVQQPYAVILMLPCFVPGGFVHMGIRE